MTQTYIAWPTGQQDIVRARIAAHRAADEIIQGSGWTIEGKGCAVGCSLDRYDHGEYSRVLGVDLRVARLVDRIHEALPLNLALDWPGRVADALQPGADTTLVADRFMVWILRQEVCGRSEQCARVASLYDRRLMGKEPELAEWKDARDAAADAADAAYAAYAAAYAAFAYAAFAYAADAAYAAYAAAYADVSAYAAYAAGAARAARSAVGSSSAAAYAAAASAAAKREFWRNAADVLIELISRCHVPSSG